MCPGQDRVHFSEEYGNINLPKKLPGTEKPTALDTDTQTQTCKHKNLQVNMQRYTSPAIVQCPRWPHTARSDTQSLFLTVLFLLQLFLLGTYQLCVNVCMNVCVCVFFFCEQSGL